MASPTRSLQDLAAYRTPADWSRCRPFWFEALWCRLGQPLLGSGLPGTGWRRALPRAFGARIGAGGCLKPRLRVTFPWRLAVGDHCWLGEEAWIDNLACVVIGDRTCLSQGVSLSSGHHDDRSADFGAVAGNPAVPVRRR